MPKEFKPTKAQAKIVADKITMIFNFVGMLTEEDVSYLKEISKDLLNQSSKLRAVQGVMVDYDKAEAQMKWNNQAKQRINGILAIRDAIIKTEEIEIDKIKSTATKTKIEEMFGL